MLKVAILTISDTRTEENDDSGEAIKKILSGDTFRVCDYKILKDDKQEIQDYLYFCINELKVELVLTTGGTGLSRRDVTPEATLGVIEREVPGISEFIRTEGIKKTNRSMLSRGVCGITNNTLIINLPGSPKGAAESLSFILDIIPHAISMAAGKGH